MIAKINNDNSVVDDGCNDNDDDSGDGDDDDDDGDDDNNDNDDDDNDDDDDDDDDDGDNDVLFLGTLVMGFYIAGALFHHEGSQTQSM